MEKTSFWAPATDMPNCWGSRKAFTSLMFWLTTCLWNSLSRGGEESQRVHSVLTGGLENGHSVDSEPDGVEPMREFPPQVGGAELL